MAAMKSGLKVLNADVHIAIERSSNHCRDEKRSSERIATAIASTAALFGGLACNAHTAEQKHQAKQQSRAGGLSIGDLSHSLSVRLIPDEERTESAKDFAVELDLGA